MANRKLLNWGMLAIVLLGITAVTGCASSAAMAYVRTDPFQTNAAEGAVIVRVNGGAPVVFDNKDGDNLKINGVAIASNEFSLPAAPAYEIKFRVSMSNRGLIGMAGKYAGIANITYAFKQDKNYLLTIVEAAGSKTGAAFLGAFLPPSFDIELYEYGPDFNENTKWKREVFSVEKLDGENF